jgi:hypothetical protein
VLLVFLFEYWHHIDVDNIWRQTCVYQICVVQQMLYAILYKVWDIVPAKLKLPILRALNCPSFALSYS